MPQAPPISPALSVGTGAPASTGATQTVSKDDFLKLLVAQLQNQDPSAPQSDTAFVAQLAQFAQLEQTQNQTTILQQMQGQFAGLSGAQDVGLVGRTVTANLNTFNLTQSGSPDPLQFTLSGDAASVKLTILDSSGAAVRTISAGALKSGTQAVTWNGQGDNGQPLPAGTYTVQVSATNGAGNPVGASTQVTGPCTGVSFDTGQPMLIIGAGTRVQLGNVTTVSK